MRQWRYNQVSSDMIWKWVNGQTGNKTIKFSGHYKNATRLLNVLSTNFPVISSKLKPEEYYKHRVLFYGYVYDTYILESLTEYILHSISNYNNEENQSLISWKSFLAQLDYTFKDMASKHQISMNLCKYAKAKKSVSD